ncbi:hypothetical protein DPMN_099616 [Dreissena polymorpha]|uniref:Uncharacterized protein n=1 Tax=Dreissena polymorpha TaxID=45954 RepID=A0A9D4LFU6_DREPO|nr:hypothetical protein DPMN_099616 [Dreissena polymorpha]
MDYTCIKVHIGEVKGSVVITEGYVCVVVITDIHGCVVLITGIHVCVVYSWNNLRELVEAKRDEIEGAHGLQNFHIECNETIVS